MKKIIAAVVMVFSLTACTDADNATRLLEANGFDNIEITGYDWFGCSEDDFQHTGFKAQGPTGKEVKGTVCSGIWFKNSTIRFQ
ncbi:hypothetical protein MYO4S_00078 [Serratia phage 4S]|nr:hypothetical protein MYO4S_00078 [Serratia phage 4S]